MHVNKQQTIVSSQGTAVASPQLLCALVRNFTLSVRFFYSRIWLSSLSFI